MVCAQVIGNDATIQLLTRSAQLQLQQFMPQIARSLYDSLDHLTKAIHMFTHKCIIGILPDRERIQSLLDHSFAYATDYTEQLGYETVASLVHHALTTGQNLKSLLDQKLTEL